MINTRLLAIIFVMCMAKPWGPALADQPAPNWGVRRGVELEEAGAAPVLEVDARAACGRRDGTTAIHIGNRPRRRRRQARSNRRISTVPPQANRLRPSPREE